MHADEKFHWKSSQCSLRLNYYLRTLLSMYSTTCGAESGEKGSSLIAVILQISHGVARDLDVVSFRVHWMQSIIATAQSEMITITGDKRTDPLTQVFYSCWHRV